MEAIATFERLMAAGVRRSGFVLGSERITTTTRRYRIGVVDGEPAPHERIHVIYFDAFEIRRTLGINDNLDAAKIVLVVIGLGCIQGHPVAKTAASTLADINSKGQILTVLGHHEFLHFICG